MNRRQFCFCLSGLAVALSAGSAAAQVSPDAFRLVEPAPAPGDKPNIWTLHFRYQPPRIVTVEVAGKKTQVWYLPFQVYNKSENPQLITPRFELVTKDLQTSHLDEPQPGLFRAVAKQEDRENVLDLKSTISISKEKIPVTKPDSFPRLISGLAIWTDVPAKASKTNRFSIYVSGLSDGLAVEALPDGNQLVKVKTLQLDFFKPTDDINPGVGDIKIEDNGGLGGERWIYRTASKRKVEAEPKKDEK